jgi:phospholipase/carboxylesterase
MRLRAAICVALLLALPGAALGKAAMPAGLTARPATAGVMALAAGKTPLADGAVAYVPESLPKGPRPLIVLLHGAGGSATGFIDRFIPFADANGAILLAAKSRGPTWDLAPRHDPLGGPLAMKSRPVIRFGGDVARVDNALKDLFGKAEIDPRRVIVLGFSDGASYALSLGLANPQLFTAVLAFSPGFVVIPALVAPSQRIFIAHGRQDQVLPFRVAEKDIAGLIASNGLKPRFRPFAGDHHIDDAALGEGLAYALGTGAPASGL